MASRHWEDRIVRWAGSVVVLVLVFVVALVLTFAVVWTVAVAGTLLGLDEASIP